MGWKQDAACIESIFKHGLQDSNIYDDRAFIEILPGMVNYRELGETQPGPVNQTSKRSFVFQFSRKSRSRMIKAIASFEYSPRHWQDFTFPDEVLKDLSVEERAEFSSEVLNYFKIWLRRHDSLIWGIWRRECEDRKSGQLIGQECPHFHALLGHPHLQEKDFEEKARRFARVWVLCVMQVYEKRLRKKGIKIDAQEYGNISLKAFKVSLNKNSYRWIDSPKMAMIYVSKYVAKVEDHNERIRRGRFWGYIGDPPFAEKVTLRLLPSEATMLKRLFRKKMKSNMKSKTSAERKRLKKAMSAWSGEGPIRNWLLLSAPGTAQALKWVLSETAPPF